MCTVTLIARTDGCLVGMNRDENRARVKALPPSLFSYDGQRALHPFEPSGGTWIAVNESGLCFALLNWYDVTSRRLSAAKSRGTLIPEIIGARAIDDAAERIRNFDLGDVNPFRMIAISAREQTVQEWRWDQNKLEMTEHDWKTQLWTSSGFDERDAQALRGATFARRRRPRNGSELNWLRQLHCSHHPDCGPYSICMHRAEAATVSYSEISIMESEAAMTYVDGSPCRHAFNIAPAMSIESKSLQSS